ncbi:MAG: hypothetical protein WAW36_18870 [Methylovulum miyakonense]|uniref:hypothetical protein n=1 Tax=Methylovulum miyakonense TaxID=645578 RepID=UPI003BB580AE
MTTIPDIVSVACPFTADLLDLKGNGTYKLGGGSYPLINGGTLYQGQNYVGLAVSVPTGFNLMDWGAWQIRCDIYPGSIGSSSYGEYPILDVTGISLAWRADNIANRLKVLASGNTLFTTDAFYYANTNTIVVEYFCGRFYLYGSAASGAPPLAQAAYTNYLGLAGSQGYPVLLGNVGYPTGSPLRFSYFRIIRGAAPITEGLADPGFNASPTPRTLADPSTLSGAKKGDMGRQGGILRAAALPAAKTLVLPTRSGIVRPPATPAGRIVPGMQDKLVVPSAEKRRLGKISGTVKVGEQPVSRPVILLDRDTMRPLASTVSAADGAYQFKGMPADLSYLVAAKDTTGNYNAVVADRVTPV